MTVAIDNCPYPDTLIGMEWEPSLRSARIVVPILMNVISPNSVVDVGCAWGSWLKAFQENGVPVVRGFDGGWVDVDKLVIDQKNFRRVDLAEPFEIDGRFDLAVCLEVAEHLPDWAGRRLIQALTQAAPLVLFSAAIPGQGGHGHVNEQWPDYWASLFSTYGFRRLDPIRRHVWQNSQIAWWYRQNIFLFASDDAIVKSAALQAAAQDTSASEVEWVNKDIVDEMSIRYDEMRKRHEDLRISYADLRTLGGMWRALPAVLLRAIQSRLPWIRHDPGKPESNSTM